MYRYQKYWQVTDKTEKIIGPTHNYAVAISVANIYKAISYQARIAFGHIKLSYSVSASYSYVKWPHKVNII